MRYLFILCFFLSLLTPAFASQPTCGGAAQLFTVITYGNIEPPAYETKRAQVTTIIVAGSSYLVFTANTVGYGSTSPFTSGTSRGSYITGCTNRSATGSNGSWSDDRKCYATADCGTCTDTIKNGLETGVDCGGPCAACPVGCDLTNGWYINSLTGDYSCYADSGSPPLCAKVQGVLNDSDPIGTCPGAGARPLSPRYGNSVKDSDEVGVDCGGSNPNPCVLQCPAGYVSASTYTNLQHVILFGFFSGGDYSNDPNACVKMDPYDPSIVGPADCSKTWLSYEEGGVKKAVCGDLRRTYPAAADDPVLDPVAVDLIYPPAPDSPGGPINPDTSTPPTSSDIPDAQNCTNKTMSDGSVCTICTSPGGGGSVNCVGLGGDTLTSTKPTTQTPIVDGCNTITYGNGIKCDVCRDPATGVQTVNCKDGSGAPAAPDQTPGTSVGDGLLGSIDKKMGDVRGQLQGVGFGISGVVNNTQKGNALQTQANQYLKTISEKNFGSTTNVNTSGIESRIDSTNSNLSDIKNIFSLNKSSNHDSEISALSTVGNQAANDQEALFNNGLNQIKEDYDPDSLPVSENISTSIRSAFPASTACTDLSVNMAGHIFNIPCAPFVKFKELFSWLLYVMTLFTLYEIFITSSPKKG